MRGRRHVAAIAVAALAASLVACAPALPDSVVPGTEITVGWSGEFTSTNAMASPTSGNRDVAEAIRADFGDVVDGEFIADESFGTVEIVSDAPFRVRYDLAEPSWSDGIPLDAADLLLGWAGSAGFFVRPDDIVQGTPDPDAVQIPHIDEFARAIEVTSDEPLIGWQSAVTAPVPAHVVGARAFGADDPMQAKQAVIRAISDRDADALAKIAEVWNGDFTFDDSAQIPADLLLSSGPFAVESITRSGEQQSVTLVPNAAYTGVVTAKVARIALVPRGDDPLAAIGESVDVAQVAPTSANRTSIRDLKRKDITVDTTHDGTLWSLQLDPTGIFSSQRARAAFIRSIPANALSQRGGGEWATEYVGTTSMIASPASEAYDIVAEDSGFTQALGTPADEPALEREQAGLPDRVRVCVLYDKRSEFATGAFAALREATAEGGWNVADCGSDDYSAALAKRRWDAVIARVPIPETPAQIAEQWGSQATASLPRLADPARDELIAKLAQTTDVYEAREVRAQIEASIVRAAVALPIATNPRLTIVNRGLEGVTTRNGAVASLTFSAAQWAVNPKKK